MISVLVGTVFLVTINVLIFSAFFVLSKIKWAALTSNERSQLMGFLFPIGVFGFLSKNLFLDPTFLDSDLCYIFSAFFGIIGSASIFQRKYFSYNLSRWRLLFQYLEIYYTIFFFVAAFILLFCGVLIHLQN